MKNILKLLIFTLVSVNIFAQTQSSPEKTALKYNINESGTHYIQATFLNQTWLRFNESNPGTLVEGTPKNNTFDIGLRRTRMQVLAQITDKVFLYFQFGQNNFNSQYNSASNRKIAAFFHDAVCEYKISKGNELKVGGGLTILNGLSRFSQPSIGTIMTMDVPVFAQATVDQTDQFSRKLTTYARGQIGKFDYRFAISDPFPITSNGQTPPALSQVANFAQKGHQAQFQGYLMYQFFEHEAHTTPYMTGTYLGAKKVFNVAIGGILQKNAMWRKGTSNDTLYQDMKLFSVESFLDIPLNKDKKNALSAYAGFFHTNYGKNYLRYNGIMNPANSTNLNSANSITGQGPTFGNGLPMFGTGNVIYTQIGYLFPKPKSETFGRIMPYLSATLAKYDYLTGIPCHSFNAGINYFVKEHKAKFTLDLQNRPTYQKINNVIEAGKRKNSVVLQYQIFF